jgi:hypothetical protein
MTSEPDRPPDRPERRFVSEELSPQPGSFDPADMARGEPGLPRRFAWRGRTYEVVGLLAKWKSSRREGGSLAGEMCLRRHWFRVLTDRETVLTIYCERQVRRGSGPKARWWVYSQETPG